MPAALRMTMLKITGGMMINSTSIVFVPLNGFVETTVIVPNRVLPAPKEPGLALTVIVPGAEPFVVVLNQPPSDADVTLNETGSAPLLLTITVADCGPPPSADVNERTVGLIDSGGPRTVKVTATVYGGLEALGELMVTVPV